MNGQNCRYRMSDGRGHAYDYWLKRPWLDSIITTGLLEYRSCFVDISQRCMMSLTEPRGKMFGRMVSSGPSSFCIYYELSSIQPIVQLLDGNQATDGRCSIAVKFSEVALHYLAQLQRRMLGILLAINRGCIEIQFLETDKHVQSISCMSVMLHIDRVTFIGAKAAIKSALINIQDTAQTFFRQTCRNLWRLRTRLSAESQAVAGKRHHLAIKPRYVAYNSIVAQCTCGIPHPVLDSDVYDHKYRQQMAKLAALSFTIHDSDTIISSPSQEESFLALFKYLELMQNRPALLHGPSVATFAPSCHNTLRRLICPCTNAGAGIGSRLYDMPMPKVERPMLSFGPETQPRIGFRRSLYVSKQTDLEDSSNAVSDDDDIEILDTVPKHVKYSHMNHIVDTPDKDMEPTLHQQPEASLLKFIHVID